MHLELDLSIKDLEQKDLLGDVISALKHQGDPEITLCNIPVKTVTLEIIFNYMYKPSELSPSRKEAFLDKLGALMDYIYICRVQEEDIDNLIAACCTNTNDILYYESTQQDELVERILSEEPPTVKGLFGNSDLESILYDALGKKYVVYRAEDQIGDMGMLLVCRSLLSWDEDKMNNF